MTGDIRAVVRAVWAPDPIICASKMDLRIHDNCLNQTEIGIGEISTGLLLKTL